MTTRCVIYTRISRDDEGEALGVARQREDCLARAEREGWQVVDVLVENDVGASERSKKPRPIYADMLRRARQREFGVILAYSNSRLTRRPMELEDLITLHERTGVRVCTVVSGDDDLSTADGRMVARIKASADSAEADRISERVRRKFAERRGQGLDASGGVRPFGYTADRLHVVEHEAAAIREAAARILGGASVNAIVTEWNTTGTPATVTGAQWTSRTLSAVLKSPRMAGLVAHKDKVVGPARWPAILDRSIWERVRVKLGSHTVSEKRTRRLLSGLLYCADCGTKMLPGGQAGAYRCSRALGGCGKVSRKIETLDEHVVSAWVDHMRAETGSELWHAEYEQDEALLVERLLAERDDISLRIGSLRTRYATSKIGDEDFFPVLETLRARLDEIERELDPHTTALTTPHGHPITGAAIPWLAWFHAQRVTAPDEDTATLRQQELLRRSIERIAVGKVKRQGSTRFDPSTVQLHWRQPAPADTHHRLSREHRL